MMAGGNVLIDSPKLTGTTGRLEVWFQQAAAAGGGNVHGRGFWRQRFAGPGSPLVARNDSAASFRPPRTGQQFDVGGKLVRVQMTLDNVTNDVTDADISVDGNATLAKPKPRRPAICRCRPKAMCCTSAERLRRTHSTS